MKAVIPAAGKGTRFHPWTHYNAKELLPVPDPKTGQIKATIELVAEEAYSAGLKDILVITALGKSSIQEHLTKQQIVGNIPRDMHLHFTSQHEPKGLGNAVLYAENFANEDFALLLGDDFHDINPLFQLLAIHNSVKYEKFGAVLTVMKVPLAETKRYGIVKTQDANGFLQVVDIIEKPENPPSQLAVTGRYIVSKKIFDFLRTVTPDKKGEVQLTDALKAMIESGYKVFCVEIQGKRYDVGEPAGWYKAIREIGDAKLNDNNH